MAETAQSKSLWLSSWRRRTGCLALTQLHDQFLAIFFAYLAYTSYMTLRASFGPRRVRWLSMSPWSQNGGATVDRRQRFLAWCCSARAT